MNHDPGSEPQLIQVFGPDIKFMYPLGHDSWRIQFLVTFPRFVTAALGCGNFTVTSTELERTLPDFTGFWHTYVLWRADSDFRFPNYSVEMFAPCLCIPTTAEASFFCSAHVGRVECLFGSPVRSTYCIKPFAHLVVSLTDDIITVHAYP